KDFMISGPACLDIIEESSPRVSHATADAIEVKPDALLRVKQPTRHLVQSEAAGRRLFEHALVRKVGERPVQGIGITTCRGGKGADLVNARGDMLGDP